MNEPKEYQEYHKKKKACLLIFLEKGSHEVKEIRISYRNFIRECYSYSGIHRNVDCWVVDNCGKAHHCVKVKDFYKLTPLSGKENTFLINEVIKGCCDFLDPTSLKKYKNSKQSTEGVDLWESIPK